VTGAIISLKVARGLGILPNHYPAPIQANLSCKTTILMIEVEHSCIPTSKEIMADYPTVFDGQVRVMEGEQFTITLQEDAISFCLKTPWTVPFAYWEKLKMNWTCYNSKASLLQ